jgi:major vault protein
MKRGNTSGRKDRAQEAIESFSSIVENSDSTKFHYEIIRIPPFHYLHVLDNNANVVRVVEGPSRYTCLGHEKVLLGPEPMIVVPPRHYATIENPVLKDKEGRIVLDRHRQAMLRHGELEIRGEREPFPLYPGEKLSGPVQPLVVVAENTALRLKALCDFEEGKGDEKGKSSGPTRRVAGEEWLFPGPHTYFPRVDTAVMEVIHAVVLKPDQALHLRAYRDFVDRQGVERKAGEEWLVRTAGAYLPDVNEKLVSTESGYILTEDKAIHLRAKTSFTDIYGNERKAGDEWLITSVQGEVHIPDVYEEVVGTRTITSLSSRQYCVILNPLKNGQTQLGSRELRRGPLNFFLQPGEVIENGRSNEIYLLMAEDGLLMRAREPFEDAVEQEGKDTKRIVKRRPGDKWLVCGPREYIPPLESEVIRKERALIQLEGLNLYIFNLGPVVGVLFLVLFVLWFLGRSLASGGASVPPVQEL